MALKFLKKYDISATRGEFRKSPASLGYYTPSGSCYLLCIFHKELTPSLWISRKTPDYFHCFGCGKSGPVILLSKILKENQFKKGEMIKQRPVSWLPLFKYFELDSDEIPF